MRLIDADALIATMEEVGQYLKSPAFQLACIAAINEVKNAPTVDAVPVPVGGIGELSDGYHTFNGLYYQRMMLFAVLVKTYKDRSWKSRRHSDGEPCFGGGWFIVGIDTPQGSYTYHYEDKYFDMFDCIELSKGKEWDGHTEDDVTRLLSLDVEPVRHGKWIYSNDFPWYIASCNKCGYQRRTDIKAEGWNQWKYCPNCGAKMDAERAEE